MRRVTSALAALVFLMAFVQGCNSPREQSAPAAGSGDAAFRQLAAEILEYTYKQDPTNATQLGIHKYDDRIADYSAAAVKASVEAVKSFQTRIGAVDPDPLTLDAQLDLEQTK